MLKLKTLINYILIHLQEQPQLPHLCPMPLVAWTCHCPHAFEIFLEMITSVWKNFDISLDLALDSPAKDRSHRFPEFSTYCPFYQKLGQKPGAVPACSLSLTRCFFVPRKQANWIWNSRLRRSLRAAGSTALWHRVLDLRIPRARLLYDRVCQ